MPTREEMRSLAQEIVGSYKDRVAGIAQLRETVKIDLKGFQDSRIAMAKELRNELTKNVGDRKVAISTQLKELDADHAAMSREMRAELTGGRRALVEDERQRQSEAREFIDELCQAIAEEKSAVKTLLGEFDSSHRIMSKEMRADLAKGRRALAKGEGERQSEAREFMGELGRAVAEGKAAAQTLLRDFGEEQAGARDEWQKLTATIPSQRGGLAVAVKPLIEEIAGETAALREQIFEYLANHPDGTKLVDLEEVFGLARIQMAKIIRNLMDENKVEKQNLLYFAV